MPETLFFLVMTMVKCPECGEEIKESFTKCPYCGHVMSKEKSKSSTGIGTNKIIAIVAVIVVVAVVGVLLSGMLGGDSSADSVDKDSSASADEDGEYWASINADKFHLPSCEWPEKISEDNKIIYHSREDAIADGKEPCGECDP